jgi:hypothetical protein
MSNDSVPSRPLTPAPPNSRADEDRWIEIFADRVAEDLKQILQEDMDWMTSIPILERLNRLREVETSRRARDDHNELRKAS